MAHNPRKSYEIDMIHGPILPKLLQFAVPLMCSSVLQLLFNAADIVVVGRWAGDNSLAAVGSNSALIGLLTNLFIGLAVGSNTLAAKYYGAGDKKELHKTVHTSMLLSIISGVLLTVVGVFGARTILIWMQTPANVLDLAALYLRIYFLGMTPTMVYNFGAALLRAQGDTQRPLYFLFLAGVVNIILNLFFVIVMKLDVAGVAIATVISQCISATLVVLCMVRDTGPLHLDLRAMRIHGKTLRQILRIGLPAGFQGILFSLSNVVIQSSVNTFGEVVMAGNSAAANIEPSTRPPFPLSARTWAPATIAGSRRPSSAPNCAYWWWALCWATPLPLPEDRCWAFTPPAPLWWRRASCDWVSSAGRMPSAA